MLSKKMAFSLTSLITILALAFVAPIAMAAVGGPTVKISTKDHSADDGKQVDPTPGTTAADNYFVVTVEFSDAVNMNGVEADGTASTVPQGGWPANDFTPFQDVMWVFTNKDGREKAAPTITWKQINGKKYEAKVITGGTNPLVAEDRVIVYVPANQAKAISGKSFSISNQASDSYTFQIISADKGPPMPVRLKRLPPQSGFMADKVTGPFEVKIVLSEKPKEFKSSHIGVKNGSAGAVVPGGSIERWKYLMTNEDESHTLYDKPDATPANDIPDASGITATTDLSALNPMPTGNDGKFYRYSVTITPDLKKDKVIVWVKDFVDNALDPANKYTITVDKVPDDLVNKKTKLEVDVDLTNVDKPTAAAGTSIGIPNDTIIPAGGYLVVVRDDGDGANEAEKSSESMINHPGDRKNANLAGSGRSAIKQMYNVVPVDLKRDLEGFLIRGGTIDLIAPDAGVMISEIMWATDGGDNNRQWIEIHNTGSTQLKTKDYKFMLYTANEALPDMTDATKKIQDRVSTLYKGTNHWSIIGKGQSGQTKRVIERRIETVQDDVTDVDIDIAVVSTNRLVSMERAMMADGMYADGTMASSWAASMPPSSNFTDAAGGLFVGSPGASPINPVADVVVTTDAEPTEADVATAQDIDITEIMVDTGNGRLPQWIELTNVSEKEVRLKGWSVEIENTAADADVIGHSLEIDLGMYMLGVRAKPNTTGNNGKSLLLVGGTARSSSNLAGSDRVVDITSDLGARGRYAFLSSMGFKITLVPPQKTGVLVPGDMAGNLDAKVAWDIPMDETGRSSLIRLNDDTGVAMMGTAASGWVLASSTFLVSGPTTWIGSDEDAGTPGYDSGGPLPVELSHFRPARDQATGAVVITWATQSELNNAGFFIKRSNQRDGEFKVVNPTMVPGAGTTSEKQFYTYTDTTAQPNIVYYYQIEDVSLDGNRQTLTRGIRLKGHIGAAGKLTSTWGELKSSNE